VDEEGVKAERVQVIDNGILRDLLMSRRPGPDLMHSNGHGRAAYLADARPLISNLFFTSTAAESPADLKKKFLDTCKQNGNKWCLLVRAMDNPVLGVREQDDLSEMVMGAASGAATKSGENENHGAAGTLGFERGELFLGQRAAAFGVDQFKATLQLAAAAFHVIA